MEVDVSSRKKKKPRFIRRDYAKRKNLGKKWRRPKGIDNKLRLKIKGHGKKVSQGYRSTKKTRGLNKSGLREVLINSSTALSNLKENQIPVISKTVGLKKRIEIVKKAKELNLSIQNIKDLDLFLKKVEEKIKQKKDRKQRSEDKKKKFTEEIEKKAKEKSKDKEKEGILKTEEPKKSNQQQKKEIVGEKK